MNFIDSYTKKYKLCQAHIHAFKYDIPIRYNHKSKRKNYKKSKSGEKEDKSLNRTRSRIKDLIDCNVTYFSKFITFTFRENISDRKYVLNALKYFKIKFKDYYKVDFKYLAVLEKQKRGAYHFHIICFNSFKFDLDKIQEFWTYGFIQVKKIDSVKNIGLYLMKYISKELMFLNQIEKNQKFIFVSKGLKSPMIFHHDLPDELRSEDLKLIYCKKYCIKLPTIERFIDSTGEAYNFTKVNNVDYKEYLL